MKIIVSFFFVFFMSITLSAQPQLTVQSKSPCAYNIYVQTTATTYNFLLPAYGSKVIDLANTETPCEINVIGSSSGAIIKAYGGACPGGVDSFYPVAQCVDGYNPITPAGAGSYNFAYWLQ